MKIFVVISFLFSLLWVSTVSAANQYGPFKVSSLRIASDGGIFVEFSPAPSACNGGAHYRMHARVSNTKDNYNAMVSTLLTAYTTGQQFRYIWYQDLPVGVDSCSNSNGEILDLTVVEFSKK